MRGDTGQRSRDGGIDASYAMKLLDCLMSGSRRWLDPLAFGMRSRSADSSGVTLAGRALAAAGLLSVLPKFAVMNCWAPEYWQLMRIFDDYLAAGVPVQIQCCWR